MFAQNINSYKYVIVPNKFDFLKESNAYQVNALTRFLFEKYGFKAFMEKEELPQDYNENGCNALYAQVKDKSGIFVTRLKVVLKNCKDQEVFVSEEGTSREKDFKKAYHEALREAFQSIKELNYHYSGNEMVSADPSPEKKEDITRDVKKEPEVAEVQTEKPKEDKIEKELPVKKITEASYLADKKVFIRDNSTFYLKKDGDNYKFYQQGMQDPFAELISTSRENQFIYSSFSGKGIAYFNEAGDLIVEVPGENGTSTDTRIYKLKGE